MKRAIITAAAILLGLVLSACTRKLNLPTDLPAAASGGAFDTSYVLVTPIWTSANGVAFSQPYDVYVGYDLFLYICDTGNNRIIKMTEQGDFVEQYSIVHPVAVTQDHGFDLLAVCGDYKVISADLTDTTLYGNAIYRRDYSAGGDFTAVWRADSPYAFTQVHGTTIPVEAEFWAIAASPFTSKDYYVADFIRNRILQFSFNDQPLTTFVGSGRGVGITEFPVDLYVYQIAGFNYLVYGQGYGNLGVQPLSLPNGVPLFNLNNENDTLPELVRFNHRGFKDVAVDEQSNFYVIVEEPDPILHADYYFYKFNRYGAHVLSFGTTGSGERQFNRPEGIDYLHGIIYIADSGNNRIVRYTLATSIRQ